MLVVMGKYQYQNQDIIVENETSIIKRIQKTDPKKQNRKERK